MLCMDLFTVSDAAEGVSDDEESTEKLRTDAVSLEIMTWR